MATTPDMRDLAHLLLTYEADGGDSEPPESPTLRVYEKLRQSLVEFVGISGFQSLAARALTLAKQDATVLDRVRIAPNGFLEGLGEIDPQSDLGMPQAAEFGLVLIARLLGLLSMFLGEALTFSLLRSAWPSEVFEYDNAGNGRKS